MSTTGAFSQINSSARFSPADFQIADTLAGDNVTYSYFTKNPFSSVETCGQPMLPVKYQHFIIPYGMKIDSITFAVADTLHENLYNFLFPAQYPVATCVGCPKPPFCNIDSAIYFTSTSYPIENATPAGQGYWHTANIVTVAVYPYQYLPVSNKIIFSGTINFTIWFSLPAGSSNFPDSKKMRKSKYDNFVSSLNHLVSNSINISQYITGIEVADFLPLSVDPPNNEYIVIAPKEFAITEAMEMFVDWKKKRGIDIKVITIEEVYAYTEANSIRVDDIGNNSTNAPNSYNIAGNAAKLRKYLTRVDSLGGAQWILLIGDNSKLPIQKYSAKLDQQLYGLRDVVTDKYFADFTSDYNVDGDPKLGEFRYINNGWQGDNVDVFPEAYLGRIPCSSTSEFQVWVNKLLNYETDPGTGSPEYLKSFVMTMADEMQNSLQNNAQLMNNLNIFQPLNIYKEVDDWNDPEPIAPLGSVIISALNTSPSGWWTWSNHGSISSFATMTNGENSGNTYGGSISSGSGSNGLLSMTNTNKYGIFHSGNCDVAFFPSPTSMVKAALFNPNGGCVVFSGNSSLGWIDMENAKLINLTGIIKVCTNGSNLYNKNLCVADWNSYSYAGALNETQYETYLTHNYFGDPEMMYYTKVPTRLEAKVSPRHIDKTALLTNLSVTIKNLAYGHKVDVNLYQPGNLQLDAFAHKLEVTGVSGNVTIFFTLPANLLTEGTLYVTISGFNYLPFTDDLLVSPGCSKQAAPNDKLIIATTPAFPWAGTTFINQDVIIKSPATLTIKGEVYFVPEAKLIVEPGAKLIIDGGKLGASCEALWRGVEVWGNSNLSQYSNSNQGFVQVTNNGSINDAVCAISTAQLTGFSYLPGTTGGIFSCTNAKFTNNLRCIHVYSYQFGSNNYNSNLSRCDFLLDDKYIPGRYPQSTAMIWYDQIKGIGNSGLSFKNTMIEDDVERRGIGILATNSGLGLNKICDSPNNNVPCDQYRKPYFEGLYYGIKCSNTGALKNVLIGNCNFINNTRGIYLSAVTNPSITLCTFETKANVINSQQTNSSGIYLDACTGYTVQEDTFQGHYSQTNPITYETGIVINNSGTAPNEIYNNTFTKLQNGITAQDNNLGLVCKCNDYSGVKTDKSILITGGSSNTIGIALYQGDGLSLSGPAGNTFSMRTSGTGDIYNQGVKFNYYHHQNIMNFRLKPEYYEKVDLIPYNFENYTKQTACPSKLSGGGINQQQIKDRLASTELLIEQKQDSLAALIDGGNTEQTTEDVVYSSPQEALILRDDLLSKSPYLSDTVMQSAVANEYVLPNAIVRDILLANPQSATSDPVMDELDKRIDPMPDEMFNQILDGELMISPKQTKEAELASLKLARETNYNTLVSYYLADTTGTLNDSLDQFLMNENKPEAWYVLAFKQLSEGNTVAAGSTFAAIPATFNLSPAEMIIHEECLSFFAVVESMNADSLPGYECDSLQFAALTLLMQEEFEPISSYARNLLIANGALTYNEPYLVADELKSTWVKRERRSLATHSATILTLSPNPCRHFVIAGYSLENNTTSDAFLTINTLQGVEIKTIQLIVAKDQVVIGLNNFSPGVYVASLKAGGKLMDSKKIIIVK